MQVFIPAPSSKLQLTEAWSFSLPNLCWNKLFWEAYFQEPMPVLKINETIQAKPVILYPGVILTLSKIDFRPNDPFPVRLHLMKKDNQNAPAAGRMWVGLDAANRLQVQVL